LLSQNVFAKSERVNRIVHLSKKKKWKEKINNNKRRFDSTNTFNNENKTKC